MLRVSSLWVRTEDGREQLGRVDDAVTVLVGEGPGHATALFDQLVGVLRGESATAAADVVASGVGVTDGDGRSWLVGAQPDAGVVHGRAPGASSPTAVPWADRRGTPVTVLRLQAAGAAALVGGGAGLEEAVVDADHGRAEDRRLVDGVVAPGPALALAAGRLLAARGAERGLRAAESAETAARVARAQRVGDAAPTAMDVLERMPRWTGWALLALGVTLASLASSIGRGATVHPLVLPAIGTAMGLLLGLVGGRAVLAARAARAGLVLPRSEHRGREVAAAVAERSDAEDAWWQACVAAGVDPEGLDPAAVLAELRGAGVEGPVADRRARVLELASRLLAAGTDGAWQQLRLATSGLALGRVPGGAALPLTDVAVGVRVRALVALRLAVAAIDAADVPVVVDAVDAGVDDGRWLAAVLHELGRVAAAGTSPVQVVVVTQDPAVATAVRDVAPASRVLEVGPASLRGWEQPRVVDVTDGSAARRVARRPASAAG